jgi:hypothetical protein
MMSKRLLLVLLIAGALAWWYASRRNLPTRPAPTPNKPADSKPAPKKRRRLGEEMEAGGKPVEGGRVSPDNSVELVCDLPESERKKNIASKGLGCCVFRSIEYAARWQQVPPLYNLPEQMRDAGIAGGGYPDKVTKIMAKFAPGVPYIQDTSGDPEVLEAILKSGRMPCITYDGHDCHYSGSIAHMVCLPAFDRAQGWASVGDNNFIKEDQFVWQSPQNLIQRWKGGGGGGWVVALLAPPPPPVPHN